LPVAFLDDMPGAVDAYRRDGYLVIRDVLDAGAVAACIEHLRDLQATPVFCRRSIVAPPLSTDAFLAALAVDTRLTIVAASLLGREVVPFGCTYIVKDPGSGLPALWHQDGHPWKAVLGIPEAVTLWIALDPADCDNGGLEVIPGTHRLPAAPLREVANPPNLFGWGMDDAPVESERRVQLSFGAGDASAHHPQLIHSSAPNRSERRRRALVIRYRPR
jgi:ectoine hydroxylase-related dioxygenase (phytanoyl-CoA dioxygenase family)